MYYAKYYHTLIFMTPGLLGLLGLLPSQVKRVYLSHSLTHSEDPRSLTQPFSHSVIQSSHALVQADHPDRLLA
eukprot:COSAG06_NODE_841_length_11989_cov_4.537763_4_plen_73_part_00